MQTIKTIVVVAVLCGIGYGVYVVLNPPAPNPPKELADVDPDLWSKPPEVSMGPPMPMGGSSSSADHDHDHQGHDHAEEPGGLPSFPQPLATSAPGGGSPASASPASPSPSSPLAAYGESSPSAPAGGVYSAGSASPSSPSSIYGSSSPASPPRESMAAAESPSGASPVTPSGYAGAVDTPGSGSVYARADSPATSASDYLGGRGAGLPGGEVAPLTNSFDVAWRSAQQQLNNGDLALALFTLSQLYGKPELTDAQNARLIPLLDQLAGTVVYSREHHIEPAYVVSAGETLEQIARQYQVAPEFLARVNGIAAPYTLRPGEELKVVRGPFRAEVDTTGQEMTVFLNRYYAGRFPVSVGSDASGQTGQFRVTEKAQQRTDYSTGQPVAPGQPGNPYGQYWIGLGGNLGLHGAPLSASPSDTRGSLRLAPQDAADVFLILADGSEVTIR